MDAPVNLFEYEQRAQEQLTDADWDYVSGGAADEITLHRTRQVFDSITLRPRVLAGVSSVDPSTTVLGRRIGVPIMLAPAGFHGRAHPDAELASVRAAGALDIVMVVSSGSSVVMEDIAKVSTSGVWFQQYLYRDRGLSLEMANRAQAAGYQALCITLDSAVRAKRERNIRNQYANPVSVNYEGVTVADQTWELSSDAPRGIAAIIDTGATWADFAWLAGEVDLPLVAKGIMTHEDARCAADSGAAGLIVSNHGGRQLDTTFATIEVLPEVVAEVGDAVEVYLDGGIRRGTDVLKALAFGARAVLLGRPAFWGLAVDGEAGLTALLNILRIEFEAAMAMCGQSAASALTGDIVRFPVR